MVNIKLFFFVLVAGVCFLAMYLYRENQILKDQRQQLYNFAVNRDQQVRYYMSKDSLLISKVNSVELDNKNLKELAATKELEYLKQFEGLKKNLKNLETAVNANISITSKVDGKLNDSTFTKINGKDTVLVTGKSFKVNDEFRKLDIAIIGRDISVHEEMTVPLSIVNYWERKRILGLRIGKKLYVTEATSRNPHVKIDKLESIFKQR